MSCPKYSQSVPTQSPALPSDKINPPSETGLIDHNSPAISPYVFVHTTLNEPL